MSYRLEISNHKKVIRKEIKAVWQRTLKGVDEIRRQRLLIKQLRTLIKLESFTTPSQQIFINQIPSILEQIPIRYEITESKGEQLCLVPQKN